MTQAHFGGERTRRREFLARCSAAAASVLLGGASNAAESEPATLPTIALGQYRVSRLIVGCQPAGRLLIPRPRRGPRDEGLLHAHRRLALLQQCEQQGINTHQFSPASMDANVYSKLREQGSKMQLICLHSKREDIQTLAETTRPMAMSHHGGVTDRLFGEGRSRQVHDFLKAVHDHGLLAGVSAHNPDCIKRVADEGWEADFFMTCFYYLTRPTPPGEPGQRPPGTGGSEGHLYVLSRRSVGDVQRHPAK